MSHCIMCCNRDDCDILTKLREIASTYDMKFNVKIEDNMNSDKKYLIWFFIISILIVVALNVVHFVFTK